MKALGKAAQDMVKELYPENRVFCSSGYDRSLAYLSERLPFTKKRYTSAHHLADGWEIPPHWDVELAVIRKGNTIIWDATKDPTGIIALSTAFRGEVTREELQEHLYVVGETHHNKDARPIHYWQQFRPWNRDWGFCVPHSFKDSLEDGVYHVDIKTIESEGYLDVLEYDHTGESEETIVMVSQCGMHGLANACLSGCVVATLFFDWLKGKKTKFSYRYVVSQPIIGSAYYLANLSKEKDEILGALFWGGQGTSSPYALQHSTDPDSIVDQGMLRALKKNKLEYYTGAYREIAGYDEAVWESHDIRMAGLTRLPFPEYHTTDDNVDLVDCEELEKAFLLLQQWVNEVEEQKIVRKKFEGVPCVSNPKFNLFVDSYYDLYRAPEGKSNKERIALRNVMDFVPLLHKPVTTHYLAKKFELNEQVLSDYLSRWAEKGLISLF